MGRKFSDEFIWDVQAALELGFRARELLVRYPRVSTVQIYKMKSNFNYFGYVQPEKLCKGGRTSVLTLNMWEVPPPFALSYRLLLT